MGSGAKGALVVMLARSRSRVATLEKKKSARLINTRRGRAVRERSAAQRSAAQGERRESAGERR